jgi:hypothetical protein
VLPAELGVIAALDDRPRAGRDPVITAEARLDAGFLVIRDEGEAAAAALFLALFSCHCTEPMA